MYLSLNKKACQEETGRTKRVVGPCEDHDPGIPHAPRCAAVDATVHPADPAPRKRTGASGMLMTSAARSDNRDVACRTVLVHPSGTHAGVRTKKAPADLLHMTKRVQGRRTVNQEGLTQPVIPIMLRGTMRTRPRGSVGWR